jgi:hypothetical protein
MSSAQQHNLAELVNALAAPTEATDTRPAQASISQDMQDLLDRGLHHAFLPDTLKPKSAEAFQLAFEGIGGVARLIQWADRNPTQFFRMFARMIGPTIAPVLPAPEAAVAQAWPEWLTSRRLAYQEQAQVAADIGHEHGPAD